MSRITLLVQLPRCRAVLGILSEKWFWTWFLVLYPGRSVYLIWKWIVLLLIPLITSMVSIWFVAQVWFASLILVARVILPLVQVLRTPVSCVLAAPTTLMFSIVFRSR